MSDQIRVTSEDSAPSGRPADKSPVDRQRYTSPTLTQYGSVDDLIDSGVVGSGTSVPVTG